MAAAVCAAQTIPGAIATPALPDFAQLESAGAIVGRIQIKPENIFDLSDEAENNWLYRQVNRLHIPTRPSVIQRSLLFKTGERVSRQKIEETERLMRRSSTRYDVDIRPVAYQDGVVDIEVVTRDTWSLEITANYSRAGGDNKTSFGLKEGNLLGGGGSIGYSYTADIDRKGNELEISYPQAFDGWTSVDFFRGRFNDGKRTSLTVDRPFYSLDTRHAARASVSEEDRIDSIYNTGEIVSEFRHLVRSAELAGGWSPGLVDGWTRRYTLGALLQDNAYRAEPGRTAPVPFPVDNDMRALFMRVEMTEDQFLKVKNYNLIERAEFFVVGFNSRLQLTWSLPALGSTRADWLYALSISDGYVFPSSRILQAAARIERRIASTGVPMTQGGAELKFYAPQASRSLFYARLAVEQIRGGGIADQLTIGGQSGLRGYPSRYQAGEQRALLSIEKRAYTNWYPFRLARIGGAAFFDAGRAWGGPNQNTVNGGMLADVGIGLRVALDRAAFANVLHLDVAFPLKRADGVEAVQLLVRTEFSF